MDTSPTRHPAINGLDGSGYVVSIVRPTTEITSYVTEDDMISVTLPGKPCQVLLGFGPAGAEEFAAHLNMRLRELRSSSGQQRNSR